MIELIPLASNRILLPVAASLPSYIADTDASRHPEVLAKLTPIRFKFGVEFWDLLRKDNTLRIAFDHSMTSDIGCRGTRWFDKLSRPIHLTGSAVGTSPQKRPVIVDVGGGHAQDLLTFQAMHPNFEGRLVLQDLPETLKAIGKRLPGIESMPHDFFSLQPVRGMMYQ